ncbi:MAG: hypothetical protein WDZ69_03215 [Candidatus Pacearchaeota archaeon]
MAKGKIPKKNEFFDIKPLKDWGIIWLPISMSNISTSQKVSNCVNWIDFLGDSKVGEPKIGLNFVYCDFLYLNSRESAKKLKDKFMAESIHHKKGLRKSFWKKRKKMQIQHAFHFETWGNIYLNLEGDFNIYLRKIKDIYKKDKKFQKYLKEDAKFFKRKLTKIQKDFFLEEHLMAYLILNKKIKFRNEYVQGREKWILLSYPGVPPKAQIYLFQKNPFNFKTDNKFPGQYNLLNNKFYDFDNIDLETWNYE